MKKTVEGEVLRDESEEIRHYFVSIELNVRAFISSSQQYEDAVCYSSFLASDLIKCFSLNFSIWLYLNVSQ